MCHGGREKEQCVLFVLDEGMVWGVSRESQSGDELGSGFLEDHTVILCAGLVAERGSAALTSEKGTLKAFLGSVHWNGLITG